ncbi:MAG: dTMP kinase [Clostridiales bacterium]|nr:dTMP kinase [Clostridiales bacterium]
MPQGLFITFEGIDGCGKSTQIAMLEEYLGSAGVEFRRVREPGGTSVGEKIRNVLLDKKNDNMDPVCELLLFEAARAQITSEVIKPSMEQGITVISDRFFDSTYAYQGYARKLGTDVVSDLNLTATGGLKPDITFLLDLDPVTALARRGIRGEAEDRMEALGMEFQSAVRAGYLDMASRDDRIRVIDASRPRDEIASEIISVTKESLIARGYKV